jgi:membrane protein
MHTWFKDVFNLIKKTFSRWRTHKAPRLAAALAFYAVFSLAPLLVIAIGIAGLVLGRSTAQGSIIAQVHDLIGPNAAGLIQQMVANAGRHHASVLATIIGLLVLFFGAAGLFLQLQDALNTVWEVRPKSGAGIWSLILQRIISFAMVFFVAILLLAFLLLNSLLQILSKHAIGPLPGHFASMPVIGFIVPRGVMLVLFAILFKILPDARIAWGDVWLGALITTILLSIGDILVSVYFAHSGVASIYGAAGSLVILLLWIYYSCQILLLGAEFTCVYTDTYGSAIKPEAGSVEVKVGENPQTEERPHRTA